MMELKENLEEEEIIFTTSHVNGNLLSNRVQVIPPEDEPLSLQTSSRDNETLIQKEVDGSLDDQFNIEDSLLDSDLETYTIEEGINAVGFGKFQLKMSLFTGLLYMADAFEIMILSILSDSLHCEWNLERHEKALITTIVFVGYLFGAFLWGAASDKFGRKRIVQICAIWIFYFGLLSSLSPTLMWMLICRALVGFGLGGASQVVTLFAEFLPSENRGRRLSLMQVFWVSGVLLVVGMASIIMPIWGWRVLLFLTALPMIPFIICIHFMPDSPFYQVSSGQRKCAEQTLKIISRINQKPLPKGRLRVDFVAKSRGTFKDLFRTKQLATVSVMLFFLWFATAFEYYGIVLLSTELFSSGNVCTAVEIVTADCMESCKTLDKSGYMKLLFTSFGEVPCILLTFFIIDSLGRRNSMGLIMLCITVMTALLNICADVVTLTIIIFLTRTFMSSMFQVIYIYTPEVYPTYVRALGLGACSAMARFGPIITPFVAQVLLAYSARLAISSYAICAFIASVVAVLLPLETKGTALKGSVGMSPS